jgi:hypothetical protein
MSRYLLKTGPNHQAPVQAVDLIEFFIAQFSIILSKQRRHAVSETAHFSLSPKLSTVRVDGCVRHN